jgi:uncharacterized protein YwqG
MKIPEIQLVSNPETDEAKDAIGFKYNEEAGFSHKIGGHPDFVQGEDDWPKYCESKMTFYGQLDSVGDDYSLGDCGMVYVFVCFSCFNSESFVQSH